MSKLNKKELAWVSELQAVLDKCPSKRIQAYTIGDNSIELFDGSRMTEIDQSLSENPSHDWCVAIEETDSGFVRVNFPFTVHSTAG